MDVVFWVGPRDGLLDSGALLHGVISMAVLRRARPNGHHAERQNSAQEITAGVNCGL